MSVVMGVYLGVGIWETRFISVECRHHHVHLGLVEAHAFHLNNGHLSLLCLWHQYRGLDQQPTGLLAL